MFNPSSPQIESLFFATFGKGHRVACITGLTPRCGVTAIAACLAERAALTERRTLLLDLSGNIGMPAAASDRDATDFFRQPSPAGAALTCDRLTPLVSQEDLYTYRDKEKLRAYIVGHLTRYESVIIDAAPCRDVTQKAIPGALAAAVSDATIVVAPGKDTRHDDVRAAMATLAAVDATILGMIVNNHDNVVQPAKTAAAPPMSILLSGLARRLADLVRPSKTSDAAA